VEFSESILDLVGHTPMVRLQKVARGVKPAILAKLEQLNPGGSVKDRIALTMNEDADIAIEKRHARPPHHAGRGRWARSHGRSL